MHPIELLHREAIREAAQSVMLGAASVYAGANWASSVTLRCTIKATREALLACIASLQAIEELNVHSE